MFRFWHESVFHYKKDFSQRRKVEHYDIIVIGAGPAGCSAAKKAAEEGAKVLLLELQSQVGGPTKSPVWVPDDFFRHEFKRAEVSEVASLHIHAVGEDLILQAEGKIIDRQILEKLLAAKAAEAGAELWLGSPVKELLTEKERVKGVVVESGGWREGVGGEVVIDASGSGWELSGIFRRRLGGWKREEMIFLSEYMMANALPKKEVEIWFTSYFAPGGKVWIYPLEDGFAQFGISGLRLHPDAALDEFLGVENPKRLERAVPLASFRSQLPIDDPSLPSCGEGILAVGSTASQTRVFSSGLSLVLECGEIAGEVAVDSITEGDTSKEGLLPYEKRWKEKFLGELRAERVLHKSLSVAWDRKFKELIRLAREEVELQRSLLCLMEGKEVGKALLRMVERREVEGILGEEAAERIKTLLRGGTEE
ncbi:MAG: NAD(P)/FAD-dependent oxidoreductase [Candidatus Hadarchaeales archaeon]